MIKFVVFIAFLGLMAASSSAEPFKFSNNKIRCSEEALTLQAIKRNKNHICNALDTRDYINFEAWGRLGIANRCMCALVPQQLVWLGIVDDNVELMYNKLMTMLSPEPKDNELQLLKRIDRKAKSLTTEELQEQYMVANDSGASKEITEKFLFSTCSRMKQMFRAYWNYFSKANEATDNENFVYSMTVYDSNLFKVVLVWRGCAALNKLL